MLKEALSRGPFDLVVVGTGAGGGTLASALRGSGLRVLLIERGDFLPAERANRDARAVWRDKIYLDSGESWRDSRGRVIPSPQYYWVGGNTKVYGAALLRLRERDFEAVEHEGGVSPAWPIRYQDLERHYGSAEVLYRVHGGDPGPGDPPRSQPLPHAPVAHEGYVEDVLERLGEQGLEPAHLPVGLDLGSGGSCLYCRTCEGYPCPVGAKAEAEHCAVRPALADPSITLLRRARALRLLTDNSGDRVSAVEVECRGERAVIEAGCFVLSCGAIESAALLLRSANSRHPRGLANSSDLVGRHFMGHNVTFFAGFHPARSNFTVFPKTWILTDFYFGAPDWEHPMGQIQASGNWPLHVVTAPRFAQRAFGRLLEGRYLDFAAISEDLPDPDNRVDLDEERRVRLRYLPNNLAGHRKLVTRAREIFRRAGFPLVVGVSLAEKLDGKFGHQCGTCRFGSDPSSSVLDPLCRTHDLENLYVVDGSFLPSASAINPTLTIIAQALRVGEHLARSLGRVAG